MSEVSTPAPWSPAWLRERVAANVAGEKGLETLALTCGALAFVVGALVSIAVFNLRPVPIEGPGSLGHLVALSCGVAGTLPFVAGQLVLARRGAARPVRGVLDVVDLVAIAVAHGAVALLLATLLAEIFALGFVGASVYPLSGVVLAGAVPAVAAYLTFTSATHLSLQSLAVVLAAFLSMGVLTSTITAADPQWWQVHLSELGTTGDLSASAFNGTLVVAGILVTVLARRSADLIPSPVRSGRERVRLCLVLVGVFLGCVGTCVPWRRSPGTPPRTSR